MSNIPAGYDEDGVRSGDGRLINYEDGSNCCGARVINPSSEGLGRCEECGENCVVEKSCSKDIEYDKKEPTTQDAMNFYKAYYTPLEKD